MNKLYTIDLENIIQENKKEISDMKKHIIFSQSNNIYNYKLNIYLDFLEFFNNNKIKCDFYFLNGEYYITIPFLCNLNINHPNKQDIIMILSNVFPNLENILNNIINNKINYITILINGVLINIINIKELYLYDTILFKLIKSKSFDIDIIKYCGVFNNDKQEYYKYLFKYIDFKIIIHNSINNNILNKLGYITQNTDLLIDDIKELKNKINNLVSENQKLNDKINILIEKNENNNKSEHDKDDLEYFKI